MVRAGAHDPGSRAKRRTASAASLHEVRLSDLTPWQMPVLSAEDTSASYPDSARRGTGRDLTATRRIKSALGQVVYRTGAHRTAWRDRAVIALFHRVDDRYPDDPVTCSRARFTQFCDFFARHFIVVSLSELLDRLRSGGDISRHLAITFDDGYRDNFHFAAPELRKRGLPASFFVATDFIGTTETTWWDARQGIRSEWMTWDEVRALHAQGFEIGSHTSTHADCGRITGAEAVREIAGSKARLEAELGTRIRLFAYPFGDPDHMSEENITIVREAGFDCCLAAHGGIVTASDGLFRLRRVPINGWYRSPYQFGFEALRMSGTPATASTRAHSAAST